MALTSGFLQGWSRPVCQGTHPRFILQSFKRKRKGFIHELSFLDWAAKDTVFNTEKRLSIKSFLSVCETQLSGTLAVYAK